MSWSRLLPLLTVLLAAPAAANAQQVRVVGRVIANDTERPLGAAEVSVRRSDGTFLLTTETDSTGAFEFVVTRTSSVRIYAERFGYQSAFTPLLHFDGHRFIQVEVRLDTDAILLAPLEVVVWSDVDRSPLLDNFRQRRVNGAGIYITRVDIEKRRPMYVTDLLRTVPGVQIVASGSGSRPRIEIGRGVGQGCSTQIFVDGMLMNRGGVNDVRLDDVVSPGSIEGIEIYRGLSSIPPEFLNPDSDCGVVAVWTRRGGDPRQDAR
jgi:hypothetical protein